MVFWFMNNCVNRVRADAEMRDLSLQAHVQSSEGQKEYRKYLVLEMGDVVTESPMSVVRDEKGLDDLRLLTEIR